MTTSKKIKFDQLWAAHPMNQEPPDEDPCEEKDGGTVHGNQCAIRLGVALKKVGITVTGCAECWTNGHKGQQHVLRAEELAAWMKKKPAYFGKPEVKKGKQHDAAKGVSWEDFKGRRGVGFFKDFWPRNKKEEASPKKYTGDHIDVWDGAAMAKGNENYFERSKQVWFWPLD